MRVKPFVVATAALLFLAFVLMSWQLFDHTAMQRQLRTLLDHPGWLLAMFAAYALSFVLKAEAWRAYEKREQRLAVYLHGIHYSLLVNHLLPVKLGDLARVGVLMKASRKKWDEALHSVAVMRLLDLLVLGTISSAGMLLLGLTVSWTAMIAAAVLILAAIVTVKLLPERKTAFLRKHARTVKAVALSRDGPYIVALTTLSWVLEAVILFGVIRLSGFHFGALSLVWANSMTVGGQVFHITPGGLGTYETTLSGTLSLLGASWENAYGAALLTHGIKFAAAFLLGGYSCVRMPIGLREAASWIRRQPGRTMRPDERTSQ
ncbi:lysylphosphatidylglycerol synthase transmembrane domain-containing protein [Cohnella faecalis]|uniref:Phosphatidylglycerol lysyltransferase n=1 Tax=Cohnella faecalis TaxID=2315694 RepID=A0A398CH63_9BACL|nr:lysylphosphatidylglycerol synthase transmembrane domain-containing protein [Cohnella faecalis]RIE00429.1 UPF0104 family protein [Cohnella faecalis]